VSINSQKFLLIVNEDFGGERNTANGTLWTDNYQQLVCNVL